MEDFRVDARQQGPFVQAYMAFKPNTYRCSNVEDYVLHHREILPTTPAWFSPERKRFVDMALVLFSQVTRFNYDPESDDQRLDLSDLSGSIDLLVAPLYDSNKKLIGLSPQQCMSLFSLKQATFSHATCLWHPEWPCLALASCTFYRSGDQHTRFRNTGFNLPDEIGFA